MNQARPSARPASPARPARPRVSVVVPTRNEARNLPHVLTAIPEDVHEVVLVDGHSTDDTVEVARAVRPGIVVTHQTRRGKGNALAVGFAAVTGDVVVMLDADGSADPAEIEAFVGALVAGADFAKGTRFALGGGSDDITGIRRLGNAFLNGLVNVLFGTRYTDLCYGYNAFWADLVPVMDLPATDLPGLTAADKIWGDGFEIETLINVRVAAAGAVITEVGSVERPRIHGESNLNAVTDGLRVLRTIVAERLRRHPRLPARPTTTATANATSGSAPAPDAAARRAAVAAAASLAATTSELADLAARHRAYAEHRTAAARRADKVVHPGSVRPGVPGPRRSGEVTERSA